jgi:hypothetical protein
MESHDAYRYKPLNKPNGMIRLIQILSTTPHIRCELRVASLDAKPAFSALSYVWGDSTVRELISVDGGALSITTNLAHALRDVHNQWSQGHYISSETAQWLWADAICINQNDVEEKNCQVPLMETIYCDARMMFAWLGIDGKITRGGIESIELVAREVSKLPQYNVLIDPSPDESDKLTTGDLDLDWSALYLDESDSTVEVFRDISGLMYLPYWKRLWIVQEPALAQSTVLLAGPKTMSWDTACAALR